MMSTYPNKQQPSMINQQEINSSYKRAMPSYGMPSYIDANNISILTSQQYLHNYTYLQYSMFPQLFQLYISTMNINQLAQQLNSYVSTFLQFFVDGIAYDTAYQLNLLTTNNVLQNYQHIKSTISKCVQYSTNNNNQITKQLHHLINSICIFNKSKSASQQQRQQQQMLSKIIKDIKTKRHLINALFKLICLLVSKLLSKSSIHSLIIECPMPKYLLHSIIIELEQQNINKLNKVEDNNKQTKGQQQMYRLLRERLILKLTPIYLQVYILYTSIINGRMKLIDITNWQWQTIINNLQLADGLQLIISLLKHKNIHSNNIIIRENRQHIIIENRYKQGNQQYCIQDCSQLSSMNNTIKQCFSIQINKYKQKNTKIQKSSSTTIQISSKQPSTMKSKQPQSIMKGKQLSIENIQKVLRKFAKLFYTKQHKQVLSIQQLKRESIIDKNKMQQELISINNNIIKNKQCINIDESQQHMYNGNINNNDNNRLQEMQYYFNKQLQQQQYQQQSLLSRLPSTFLVPYCKLLNSIHSYQYQHNNSVFYIQPNNNNSIQVINQLFQYINKTLRQLLTFKPHHGQQQNNYLQQQNEYSIIQGMRVRVNQLQLQVALIIQTLSIIQQTHSIHININSAQSMINSTQSRMKKDQDNIIQSQQTVTSQQQQRHRLIKIKQSLYTNLITLKILNNSININNHYESLDRNNNNNKQQQNNNKQQQQYKQKKQQNNEQQQLTVKMISDMFQSIFQLSTNTSITNNKTNNPKNICHPSLQTVLYMFSALQLWVQLKYNNNNANKSQLSNINNKQLNNTIEQVHEFLSNVIKKYSQPNVVIPNQQLIYVKYIIQMFQIFTIFLLDPNNNNNTKNIYANNNNINRQSTNKQSKKVVEKIYDLMKLQQSINQQQQQLHNINNHRCRVRLQELINVNICLERYINKLVPNIIAYIICLSNKQQQQRQHKNQQQYTHILSYTKLITMNIDQQSLTYEGLSSYINYQIISKLPNILLPKQSKQQIIVVDLNQSIVSNNDSKQQKRQNQLTINGNKQQIINNNKQQIINNNTQTIINGKQEQDELVIQSEQTYSRAISIFKTLSTKYHHINTLKKQLLLTNNKTHIKINKNKNHIKRQQQYCELSNLFDQSYQLCYKFIISSTSILIDTNYIFLHIRSIQSLSNPKQQSISQCQPLTIIDKLHLQQLHYIQTKLCNKSHQLTQLSQHLNQLKLNIYKLSQTQIQYLLKQYNLNNNQQNKNKILQKVKHISKLIDTLLIFCVFIRSYIEWMLMETIIKIQSYTINHTKSSSQSVSNNNKYLQSQLSSFHLLRLLTLISWLPSNNLFNANINNILNTINISNMLNTINIVSMINTINISNMFSVNFEYLQQHLQSNIQPQLISTANKTNNSNRFTFNKLPINKQLKQQLKYVQNYQFLQFLYQYLPFDITTSQQQQQLLSFIKQYTLHQHHHLYLSPQKTQKINFNTLSKYLLYLTKQTINH